MTPEPRVSDPGFSPKPKRRISGMTWLLIGIGILFAVGAAMTALKKNAPPPETGRVVNSNRRVFGVDGFMTVEGGVTFGTVEPPDGPADKAGLLGGDIIIAYDNHAVKEQAEISALLQQTPPEKTVEVIYLRDGEQKKTKLTPISEEQSTTLYEAFEERPNGQGQLGFDDGNANVVEIPGTKLHGVKLDAVYSSGPAALSGMQSGDIVTQFDGIPIRSTLELVSRVRRAIPYNSVKVVLIREGQEVTIPVKLGKRGR